MSYLTMMRNQISSWAVESMDFSSLQEDFITKDPNPSIQLHYNNHNHNNFNSHNTDHPATNSKANHCSLADNTLSTAAESSSEWGESNTSEDSYCFYGYSSSSNSNNKFHYSFDFQESLLAKEATILEVEDESNSNTSNSRQDNSEEEVEEEEEEEEKEEEEEESQISLVLEDLIAFAQEDNVGAYYDSMRQIDDDKQLPPLPRTDFKGDSQVSFTLEDLEGLFSEDSYGENDDPENEESSAMLQSPQKNKRHSSSVMKPLKGILKNGSNHCNKKKEKRASSLGKIMMEKSSMLNSSMDDSLHLDGSNFKLNEDGDDHSSISSEKRLNGWEMMQQQQDFLLADSGLDLQALEEKSVSFSNVSLYEHKVIVGDNPSVSGGVPLTIDWKAQYKQTYSSIEEYERTTTTNNKKSTGPKKLDAGERMWLLLNSGASVEDILHSEMMVDIARNEREETMQQHLLLLSSSPNQSPFIKAIQRLAENEKEVWRQGRQRRRPRTLSPAPGPSDRQTLAITLERLVPTTASSA